MNNVQTIFQKNSPKYNSHAKMFRALKFKANGQISHMYMECQHNWKEQEMKNQ